VRTALLVTAALILSACHPAVRRDPDQPTPQPANPAVAPGLVLAPCDGTGPIRPEHPGFCKLGRAYVTPSARQALIDAATAVARRHPGSLTLFMDASGPTGRRPFPPHLSHGDGREIDLALFYRTAAGAALAAPPLPNHYGYEAYEPARPGDPLPCAAKKRAGDRGDPPASRAWRLDEARTRDLIRALIADPRVRRVFIEPHLKRRLGFERETKVRFAGCWAARHDDHLHVDFR
jgi:hypothetical protein